MAAASAGLRAVDADVSFPGVEEQLLQRWDDIDAFQRSYEESKGKPEFTFYDGPPFATGLPHYGHILAGTIKDVVTRYAHQTGHRVTRRFGWDTHGLPVEFEIDTQLGVKSHEDVEAMGIDVYNAECRAIVMRYSGEWRQTVRRVGRWIDFENDYKTLNPTFMETVWWVFKQMYDKGLVYRGAKVMPYSTACHTPLSNFEAGQNYLNVNDPSVVVSFPVIGQQTTKLLAWTTTPWTLPSNLALCVNPKMKYVKVRDHESGEFFILAECRLSQVYQLSKPGDASKDQKKKQAKAQDESKKQDSSKSKHKPKLNEDGEVIKSNKQKKKEARAKKKEMTAGSSSSGAVRTGGFDIVEEFPGEKLRGTRYIPLFNYFRSWEKNGAFRVLVDDYVTDDSGTGVVHQAPAFGEDDYRVCLEAGVVVRGGPIVCPVDNNGEFTSEVSDFEGIHVKVADKSIIKRLKKDGRLILDGMSLHAYPHCWRSDTPLIYRTVPSWFINVPEIKSRLLKNNGETYWVPTFVKEKRFHNWLEEARDWSVSRDRFWGTPIPIWASDDMEEIVVIGSIKELEKLSGTKKIADIHRDTVDDITIPSRKGKGVLRRVPQVFDCWFESGSMPYAQLHYPFENKEVFENGFPADFIAEGLDQTRGWFYTLMVISTALFDKPAFKNLIVNGLVLAEDGQKMSKRLKNYPDPGYILSQYGADALRLFLINSPVVRAEPLFFSEDGVRDVVKNLLIPWYNSYRYFVEQVHRLAATEDIDFKYDVENRPAPSKNVMDRWILASLQSLVQFVRDEMALYHLYTVIPRLVDFIGSLSLWYVRFNKNRLKGDLGEQEAIDALNTMFQVLLGLCRLMAPFTPFITESQYLNLRTLMPKAQQKDSIHFDSIPTVDNEALDAEVEKDVGLMQSVVTTGRLCREKCNLSFRVPVAEIRVVHRDVDVIKRVSKLQNYVSKQLNCHQVTLSADVLKFGKLVAHPDNKRLGERLKNEMRTVSNGIRAMTPQDISTLEKSGAVTIAGHKLTTEDIQISWEFTGDASRWEVQIDPVSGIMVMLDREVTDRCRQEGVAREIMSRVQRLRKVAKLSSQDEVEVFFSSPELASLVNDWNVFMSETLRTHLLPKADMPSDSPIVIRTTDAPAPPAATKTETKEESKADDNKKGKRKGSKKQGKSDAKEEKKKSADVADATKDDLVVQNWIGDSRFDIYVTFAKLAFAPDKTLASNLGIAPKDVAAVKAAVLDKEKQIGRIAMRRFVKRSADKQSLPSVSVGGKTVRLVIGRDAFWNVYEMQHGVSKK